MTLEQLNEMYSQYTGLRIDIASLIDEAEDKEKVYKHLMWHLRKGRITERPADQEILEELVPALQEALEIEPEEKSSEIDIEATYTAEEAVAYNLTLDGALAYGAVKTAAVEAQAAVYYTQKEADAYNTEHELTSGDEGFITTETIKIPAVEGKEAVLYTNEEVDAYNAQLPGAVKEGDKKN